MLFMAVFTYAPEKRDAVLKRRAEKGVQTTGKIIGEWIDIAGGRIFRVVDQDDPKAGFAAVMAWSDLGQTELTPILTSEDAMKALASMK